MTREAVYHTVGPADRFRGERPVHVMVDGKPIAVAHLAGQFYAFRDKCPHLGAPLSRGWLRVDEESGTPCVVCQDHQWTFRLDDGACVGPKSDPATEGRAIRLYPTRVTDSGTLEIGL